MLADISLVNLHSKFFAEFVKVDKTFTEIKDGIVYVDVKNNSTWIEAVKRAKESFATSKMKGTWLMKYDVEILPSSLSLKETIPYKSEKTPNIFMPVFLPDRLEQYIFAGTIEKYEFIESAAAFLTVDAQNIIEACLPYSLSVVDDTKISYISENIYENKTIDEWANIVKEHNCQFVVGPSFRGLAPSNPLATFGDAAVQAAEDIRRGNVSYEESRKKILNLPTAGKKMKSSDEKIREEGIEMYAAAWQAMSEHERVLIFKELLLETKSISIKRKVSSVADRKKLGASTKYGIIIKERDADYKKQGFDETCKHCLFINRGENLYPLKMHKISAVIYTLSLIEKVTKNKKNYIVDVENNRKAFFDVYKIMFNDFNEKITTKSYVELFQRNRDNPDAPVRKGRLPENYNDIEAALANTFKNLDEDYSAFLANSSTPLAIIQEKIHLPEALKAIKIH